MCRLSLIFCLVLFSLASYGKVCRYALKSEGQGTLKVLTGFDEKLEKACKEAKFLCQRKLNIYKRMNQKGQVSLKCKKVFSGIKPGKGQKDPKKDYIECQSVDGRYAECLIGGMFSEVKLFSQKSSDECLRGFSYGIYRKSIWVDHSCHGVFEIVR